ncbi:MAG: NAD-dependent epimerase/dehydratase family protein [Promethearchaeota archaeon]
MLKNRKIVITGAAGFIGSHLFENLIQNHNFIYVIDNFNNYYSGKEENFRKLTQNYEQGKDYRLIKENLVNFSSFKKIDDDIDIIFHLAAQAGVRYSIENAAEVTNNNIISTLNVLEYAVKNNVKKVVFASSSSVYGNPKYTPLDEEHPKNPISPYAVSKLCCENYVNYYFREYGLPVTSLRFYTVYGPRGRPDMAIRKFLTNILRDKEIIIYGDGSQLRDFTYVSDIVNGILLAGLNPKANGEVFNLGVSNPVVLMDLVEMMYNITSKSKNIKYIEKQKGDVDITYSNTEKAKKILNYNPVVNIEEGLRKTYDWIMKNKSEII